MIKTKIDHYLFPYYIFFQISNIRYRISQNTQTREDSIYKIVITLQHITDNILQTRSWIRLRCFICVLCTAWYIVGSEDRRNTSRNSSLTQSTRICTWEKCDLFQWLQFEPTVKQNKDCHFLLTLIIHANAIATTLGRDC